MDDYDQWCAHVEDVKPLAAGLGVETDEDGEYEGPTGVLYIYKDGGVIGQLNWHPWWGPAAAWGTSTDTWASRDHDNPQDALKELMAHHAGKKARPKAAQAGTTDMETAMEEAHIEWDNHLEDVKTALKSEEMEIDEEFLESPKGAMVITKGGKTVGELLWFPDHAEGERWGVWAGNRDLRLFGNHLTPTDALKQLLAHWAKATKKKAKPSANGKPKAGTPKKAAKAKAKPKK